MGSGSSKDAGGSRVARSRGARVLGLSCFSVPSTLHDEQPEEENGRSKSSGCKNEAAAKANQGSHEDCRFVRVARPSIMPLLTTSEAENDGDFEQGTTQTDSSASSSSDIQAAVGPSSIRSSRSRTRLGFITDGISFRLGRAASMGSTRAQSLVSASLSVSNSDQSDQGQTGFGSSSVGRNETQENSTLETASNCDSVRNNMNAEATVGSYSDRSNGESNNFRTRRSSRRVGHQEPFEGSMRFSRTRSVGRLRDRVLRRTSFSDGLFGPMLLEDRSGTHSGPLSVRRVLGHLARPPSSPTSTRELLQNSIIHPSRAMNSVGGSHDDDAEASQLREAGNHDFLEHRSAFLERRRRIRSQVRALQRLGSRFENLSGHDRSCTLSGQHRTGHCTCSRASSRAINPDDDTSTRASISRIVMLAEALFEVLDEIHQQSVVLSSRPSVSSIGSIPAPSGVVECMPVKVYMKQQKYQNEEATQCYICLLEYEEGDCIRILPCHHEFHQMCIDKWLKEIHRVCPLCRGDVCKSVMSPAEKLS